jgi:hypothetical protein
MRSATRGPPSSDRVGATQLLRITARPSPGPVEERPRIGGFRALSGLESLAKRMKFASAPYRVPVNANERRKAGSRPSFSWSYPLGSPPLGGLRDPPCAVTLDLG